jgi:hypothetical protein
MTLIYHAVGTVVDAGAALFVLPASVHERRECSRAPRADARPRALSLADWVFNRALASREMVRREPLIIRSREQKMRLL